MVISNQKFVDNVNVCDCMCGGDYKFFVMILNQEFVDSVNEGDCSFFTL
jgi:hypothetical protein